MRKHIRILQIVTQMNRGGAESRLMDIYRNIDKKKIQFDFYTCRKEKGVFDKEIIELGGKIYYNDPLQKNIFFISSRFKNFFVTHSEYNIVHCHLNHWCGLVLAGAKKANVPTRIAHSRAATTALSIQQLIKNIIKFPVNNMATHKFAVSKKAGVYLFGKKAVENGEVQIWPNAIENNKFRFQADIRKSIKKELGLENNFVVIHVGNMTIAKNHIYLIKIFDSLKNINNHSKLLLIGSDNQNNKIQDMVTHLKLDNDVLFLGSRSDVKELLQAGDIFIFPSLYEGFPGAVLEAQAAGLPCLISDTITDEVCILPTTKRLSINVDPHIWAEEALKYRTFNRKDTYEVIREAGFDIQDLVEKMTVFYESVANRWAIQNAIPTKEGTL